MPKWYTTIVEEIRSNYLQITVKDLITPNPFIIQNTTIQKGDWIYTKNDNQYIIERLIKIITAAQAKMIYWVPDNNLIVTQCKGCIISTSSYYSKCAITINIPKYSKLYVSCLRKIKSDIEDIRQALQEERPHTTLEKQIGEADIKSNKNLQITKEICESLCQDQENTVALIDIASTTTNIKNPIFTILSEVEIYEYRKYAYAAWLLQNKNTSFRVQIANWPSKTKADAISIITALCVVGMESQVVFYTDSKSLKKQFERMTKRDAMQYVVDKEANWPIWSSIRTIAAKKELKVKIIYKESVNNNINTNNIETLIAINYYDLGYTTRVLS